MSTRKKSQYECKKKCICLDCGAVIASEHRKKHSDRKHPGKINFKFYIDPKQPTLQFARKDNNSNDQQDGSVEVRAATLVSVRRVSEKMEIMARAIIMFSATRKVESVTRRRRVK